MSEIEEKSIYPRIVEPTAPVLQEDNGQSFRLQKIADVSEYLEKEIKEREQLSKKYLSVSKTIDGIEAILTLLSLGAGAGGIALLSTIVAIPATIALEVTALVIGLIAVASKFVVRRTRTKSEKHKRIQTIAESKLNTMNGLISKSIADNKIRHEEFKTILEELEKYKKMKEDVRNKVTKSIKIEDEKSLIEKGKKEALEEFRTKLGLRD